MSQQELDKAAYSLAKNFLLQHGKEGVTLELVEKYLHPSTPRPNTLAGLYERMLESAQNAHMKARVIGGSIGGIGNLRPVLCDFEPAKVLEKYRSGWEEILKDIKAQLNPRGRIRRTARSIWPQYCRTILSAAKFLAQFTSAQDFYEWVGSFERLDERARPALPMLLDQEIDGFGFPLACDFVKELGYDNFSKPDVHLKDIFWALGLCPWGTSNYEVFKAVARVARNVGVTPYNVDKLFWLIGSGDFYDDPDVGDIGSHKKKFITVAQEKLEHMRHTEASEMT